MILPEPPRPHPPPLRRHERNVAHDLLGPCRRVDALPRTPPVYPVSLPPRSSSVPGSSPPPLPFLSTDGGRTLRYHYYGSARPGFGSHQDRTWNLNIPCKSDSGPCQSAESPDRGRWALRHRPGLVPSTEVADAGGEMGRGPVRTGAPPVVEEEPGRVSSGPSAAIGVTRRHRRGSSRRRSDPSPVTCGRPDPVTLTSFTSASDPRHLLLVVGHPPTTRTTPVETPTPSVEWTVPCVTRDAHVDPKLPLLWECESRGRKDRDPGVRLVHPHQPVLQKVVVAPDPSQPLQLGYVEWTPLVHPRVSSRHNEGGDRTRRSRDSTVALDQ